MQLDQLALGQVSAADLLEEHIARSGVVNPAINAVVRTDLEGARTRAAELDRLLKAGIPAGPLHGLPITIKDTFDVEGMPATSGAPEYANRPAKTADAAAVARLRAAGAVIWGKTNTPYLAGDNQTYNPVHGRTSNPWDLSRTPGGSSGGAAAALATGVTSLELGSDIGGSLRLPAHFCGVAALKPTYGRTPIIGHVPPAPGSLAVRDLNVAGPMARDVADLRLMFQVLTDQPGKDSWPITGATFILMHKVQDKPAAATNAMKFFDWAFVNGDKLADDLDYVPLPDSVKELVRKQWAAQIKDASGKAVAFK